MPSGRYPEWKPTKEQREQVFKMAKVGLNRDLIATILEVTEPTLIKHCKKELEAGSARGKNELIEIAHQRAKKSDSVLIFLLKTRLGWKETQATEVSLTAPIKLAYRESTDTAENDN